jgi:predicted RNase H-like nuclease (RuvC/YqgF family)
MNVADIQHEQSRTKVRTRKITTEQRLARIEVDVQYLQRDISEMKIDVRRLNDKIDALREWVREGGGSRTRVGPYPSLK